MYQFMIDDLSKNNNTFSGVKIIFGSVISQNLSCQQRNNDQDLFIKDIAVVIYLGSAEVKPA